VGTRGGHAGNKEPLAAEIGGGSNRALGSSRGSCVLAIWSKGKATLRLTLPHFLFFPLFRPLPRNLSPTRLFNSPHYHLRAFCSLKSWSISQKNRGRSLPSPMHRVHNHAGTNSAQPFIIITVTLIRPAEKTSASCIMGCDIPLPK
jgi:hypothetical protein